MNEIIEEQPYEEEPASQQATKYLVEREDDVGDIQQVSGAFGERPGAQDLTAAQLQHLAQKEAEQQ